MYTRGLKSTSARQYKRKRRRNREVPAWLALRPLQTPGARAIGWAVTPNRRADFVGSVEPQNNERRSRFCRIQPIKGRSQQGKTFKRDPKRFKPYQNPERSQSRLLSDVSKTSCHLYHQISMHGCHLFQRMKRVKDSKVKILKGNSLRGKNPWEPEQEAKPLLDGLTGVPPGALAATWATNPRWEGAGPKPGNRPAIGDLYQRSRWQRRTREDETCPQIPWLPHPFPNMMMGDGFKWGISPVLSESSKTLKRI